MQVLNVRYDGVTSPIRLDSDTFLCFNGRVDLSVESFQNKDPHTQTHTTICGHFNVIEGISEDFPPQLARIHFGVKCLLSFTSK